MENIFRSELIMPYSRTTNYNGYVVTRNGEGSLCIGPSAFWYGNDTDEKKAKSCGVLGNEFKPNTQYVIDLWIDADDIYYNKVSKNVAGGLYLYYTDYSYKALLVTGNQSSPIGWQHVRYITDASKSIRGLCVYFYISTPAYYRWDSSITEYKAPEVTKAGILETGTLTENSDTLNIVEGGIIQSSDFIEI